MGPSTSAFRYDNAGKVIGITIINARWLLNRDDKISITLPSTWNIGADTLAPARASRLPLA